MQRKLKIIFKVSSTVQPNMQPRKDKKDYDGFFMDQYEYYCQSTEFESDAPQDHE